MPKRRRKPSVCQSQKYKWKKPKTVSEHTTPAVDNVMNEILQNIDNDKPEYGTSSCATEKFTTYDMKRDVVPDVNLSVDQSEVNSATQTEMNRWFCPDTSDVVTQTLQYPEINAETQTTPTPGANIETQTPTIIQCSSATQTVMSFQVHVSPFKRLAQELADAIKPPYLITGSEESIKLFELYVNTDANGKLSVKLSVVIHIDFTADVFVHRKQVLKDHDIWTGLPSSYDSVESVNKLLCKLQTYYVCMGNPDVEFQKLTPIGSGISVGFTNDIRCYREGDFNASKGTLTYSSTIRSVSCGLLCKGNRCPPCQDDRGMLRKRHLRAEDKTKSPPVNYVHSKIKHQNMNREDLITKINQQQSELKSVTSELEKVKRQFQKEIIKKGHPVDQLQDLELKDLMSSCQNEIVSAYPDPNSLQRLFWEQQSKFASSGKNGMRWHPMIIRWCLYIRNKSAKAYDAMRDSGFVKLPSTRTLFDYSHYTKSALGFQPDVMKVLHEEAEKLGMSPDSFKNYVGILFDEIRIKEDLVYDKHTGELIGYCNLDSVGNQIMELEKVMKSTTEKPNLAKFMLVLMVRGVTTGLKFPLAGFATNSITADFLYPIVWKAISILECNLKLKVLFCTCDGASANRKFFQLHKIDNNQDNVFFTRNPHAVNRNIYFISDVPHLLKTARNCLSNSFSHKNTRRMWNNGKDLSWMHLVRLFEEHCEMELYNPCPKLTRGHIDLTAFSYMKVNLAAQILSDTVANALEELYDDSVAETIKFIRNFNQFFDCLNVRSIYEDRNKRNPNLNPYTDVNDDRLEWLKTTFLGYLDNWSQSVEQRVGDFSSSQKSSMKLSQQTLTGLKISILSITECVKFMLTEGADFVLTAHFNQDPLEQHFGHYRHKGGANNNPTVYDVRNMMTTLRAVGQQAHAPKRGNTQANNENFVIDNTKLHRRH